MITYRLAKVQHLKVIWFYAPGDCWTVFTFNNSSVCLLVFSTPARSQPQATSQTCQSAGTADPAIRSDYLGRTKCLCWWRACSKIWECRNQCGSSGPRSIDHDSLRIDNPCLVWLCAWIGRNEPPVNAFCTIFLVIPVSRPPSSASVLTLFLPWFIITQSKVLSEEAKFAAQALNSKQRWHKQLVFFFFLLLIPGFLL